MSAHHDLLTALGRHFLGGIAAGAAAAGLWYLVTGSLPSTLTSLITADIAAGLYLVVQFARFRRRWQMVLASYELPALGEGIDTPHRPPADEQQDGGER